MNSVGGWPNLWTPDLYNVTLSLEVANVAFGALLAKNTAKIIGRSLRRSIVHELGGPRSLTKSWSLVLPTTDKCSVCTNSSERVAISYQLYIVYSGRNMNLQIYGSDWSVVDDFWRSRCRKAHWLFYTEVGLPQAHFVYSYVWCIYENRQPIRPIRPIRISQDRCTRFRTKFTCMINDSFGVHFVNKTFRSVDHSESVMNLRSVDSWRNTARIRNFKFLCIAAYSPSFLVYTYQISRT